MASEMPVLPEVGSSTVHPGRNAPDPSASCTIQNAGRSLIDPVGLRSSSLAQSRTSADGDSRGRPTSGVPPTESSSESYRVTSPAGDGGEDRDDVAVGHRRGQSAEEADV